MTAQLNLYNDALFIIEILLFAIAITLIYIVFQHRVNKRKRNTSSEHSPTSGSTPIDVTESHADCEEKPVTESSAPPVDETDSNRYRELLLESLKKLNCTPKLSKDGDDIFIKYQGESFCIRQNNGFLRIWDLPFAEINVLDTNLPVILESINSVNNNLGPKIVMSAADDKGVREIMSIMDLIFVPTLANPEQYLATVLQMFFGIKEELRKEIIKWKDGNDNLLSIYSYAASFQN